MIVTATHDGHGSYGLRVVGEALGLYFRPEWHWITVVLPGERQPACLRLTESFWESNHELRSRRLRSFYRRNGLVPWQRNHPPHFELEPLGGGLFCLKWLEHVPSQPRLGIIDER